MFDYNLEVIVIEAYNAEVLETLNKFQRGYTLRDLESVDQFVEELFYEGDDVIIIGTGDGEICKGISDIKELVKIDWGYWGNFNLDIEGAIISSYSEVSWVVCDGILSKPFKPEVVYDNCMRRLDQTLNSSESVNDKLHKALKLISYSLHEGNVGDEIGRPVRFTGVLKRIDDKWKFCNIHFSYPVAPPTDIKFLGSINNLG